MDKFFYEFQCGSRKDYSAQQCLIKLIEKWKSAVDSGKYFAALLRDLSKAFDCLPHELLPNKLNAYGFILSLLRRIHSNLLYRKQRTKINALRKKSCLEFHNYSFWDLYFSTFSCVTCSLFQKKFDFTSYADDKKRFLSEATPENVVNSLEGCSASLFEWFLNNQMKANPEKCHILINVNRPATIKIGEHTISNSYCDKLLGVTIDS